MGIFFLGLFFGVVFTVAMMLDYKNDSIARDRYDARNEMITAKEWKRQARLEYFKARDSVRAYTKGIARLKRRIKQLEQEKLNEH